MNKKAVTFAKSIGSSPGMKHLGCAIRLSILREGRMDSIYQMLYGKGKWPKVRAKMIQDLQKKMKKLRKHPDYTDGWP